MNSFFYQHVYGKVIYVPPLSFYLYNTVPFSISFQAFTNLTYQITIFIHGIISLHTMQKKE